VKPEIVPRIATGIPGLDEVLDGGLPREGLYLVRGHSGTGKTTLALQFLIEGARRGEPAVYLTLSETEKDIRRSAGAHGWSLSGVIIHELGGARTDLGEEAPYTLFHPTEIELGELTRKILGAIESMQAPRIVIDALSELRLLSGDALRYRRLILSFAQMFGARDATVLLLDEDNRDQLVDFQIESLARGALRIDQTWPELGDARRRLRVVKVRGITFRGGYHDVSIETGGMVVFPRLHVSEGFSDFPREAASTGVPELDALLGGGLDRGATTLLLGPTGSGKSVLTTQIAVAAADRGERVGMFVFDETLDAVLARAEGLGIQLRERVRGGRIALRGIDPGEFAPWQFVRAVLDAVKRDGARMIAIDSLGGYLHTMPDERALDLALHELFGVLAQLGVVTVATLVRRGFLGESPPPIVDISYLSDTIVLLGLFEVTGEIRRAISVMKRRRGAHDHSIRELQIGPVGLRVGEPLRAYHGVLAGVPVYVGARARQGRGDASDADDG
jgi:circadian clock protein KaiC